MIPPSQRPPIRDWKLDAPSTHERWQNLQLVLGLIQEELRADQRAKLAALVDSAFRLGRECEREAALPKAQMADPLDPELALDIAALTSQNGGWTGDPE